MSAIADQSSMPLWGPWVWVLLAVAVVVALVVVDVVRERRRRDVVTLPSGRTFVRCWTHACPYAGVVPVFDRHAGVELLVCVGHAHEGVCRGYYRLLRKDAA